MRYSVELMMLAYHAMRLVAPDADIASPECPEEIRDYVLTEEEKAALPDARSEMARSIIFGLNCLTYKDHIYFSIERSIKNAESFLNQYRTSLADRYKVL